MAGKEVKCITGQAFVLDADPRMAVLTNDFVGPPAHVIEVPTPWLLDALERWLAYHRGAGLQEPLHVIRDVPAGTPALGRRADVLAVDVVSCACATSR